jgi:transcriptional regulator with XRE-family HTH domain
MVFEFAYLDRRLSDCRITYSSSSKPNGGSVTMNNQRIDPKRGSRVKKAMSTHGYRKATALAAALQVSPAALTKWTQGHAMSVDHVCNLASLLDISLDWLLLGRNGPDWLRPDQLTEVELDLIGKIRERPARITELLVRLVSEIQKVPNPDLLFEDQPQVKT